mgnify:CR=1 FL=1
MDKEKQKAQRLARNIKLPINYHCSICQKANKKLVRHHPYYKKPLFIIFVCHRCHIRIHKMKDLSKLKWSEETLINLTRLFTIEYELLDTLKAIKEAQK